MKQEGNKPKRKMIRGTYTPSAVSTKDMAECWYCQKDTLGILSLPDGSEIWCCKYCAGKHGKVKRYRNIAFKDKSLKDSQKPLINSVTKDKET